MGGWDSLGGWVGGIVCVGGHTHTHTLFLPLSLSLSLSLSHTHTNTLTHSLSTHTRALTGAPAGNETDKLTSPLEDAPSHLHALSACTYYYYSILLPSFPPPPPSLPLAVVKILCEDIQEDSSWGGIDNQCGISIYI